MAAVSLFWDTNMSAVTSCGNTFLLKKKGKRWTFSRVQFNITKWQPPAVIFFVILACARVLLWRLAIALEQMLPAGEVYFRPVMSSKSHRKPRVELIFTLVYSFLDSLLRVSQSLLNSFLYLGKLHWFPSLGQSYFYEPSVFTFRYVGERISWKTWCWNEKDGG